MKKDYDEESVFMNRFVLSVGIITCLLLPLNGCFDLPEELILPEWDVDLNVPIINKTYTIYDVLKPQSKFSITGTLTEDDFYFVQTDNIEANSQVTEYVRVLSQNSISQNFILPANVQPQPVFIVFPEGIEINKATFISGYMSFVIENPTNGNVSSSLRIPGIRKPDGSELTIESNVAAFSEDSIFYSLVNHQYILPADQPLQNKNSLQIIPSATSPAFGSYVNVEFYGYEFRFSSINGKLPRTSLGIKRTAASFNLNDLAGYRDKFYLKEGSLKFKSVYESFHYNNFDIEISNVQIIGVRNNGGEVLLERNDGQNISFNLIDEGSELILDESNSNLTEFIQFLPDSIVIAAEYILNPRNQQVVRTITDLDSLKFSAQFTTKSIFAIKQVYFIDTLRVDFNQEDRDKIRVSKAAELNIQLDNAIPLDAFITAVVTDENYNPLFTLTRNLSGIDSMQFLGAQVNINTGQIISPTVTFNTLSLDSLQIAQFANAHYLIVSTSVNTSNAGGGNPNPPTVQFKSSDWLAVKCFGKVKYHVNGEGN